MASVDEIARNVAGLVIADAAEKPSNGKSESAEKKPSKRLRSNKKKGKTPTAQDSAEKTNASSSTEIKTEAKTLNSNENTSSAQVGLAIVDGVTAKTTKPKPKKKKPAKKTDVDATANEKISATATEPVAAPTAVVDEATKEKKAKKRKPKKKTTSKVEAAKESEVDPAAAAFIDVASEDAKPTKSKKRRQRKAKKDKASATTAAAVDGATGPTDTPEKKEKDIDFDELLKLLTKDDLINYETLRAKCVELKLNVSKSLMRAITLKKDYHKCCKCERVYDTENELAEHIRESKHKYGNVEYRQNRRDLLKRVKKRLGDKIGEVVIPEVDTEDRKHLSREEKVAFNALLKNEEQLSPAEQGTLHNLLYTGICLRELGERAEYK